MKIPSRWPETVTLLFLLLLLSCETAGPGMGRHSRRGEQDMLQLYQVGVMHLNEGHLEEAQEAFRTIVMKTPDNAPAWNNLGKAYLLQKKFMDAEAAFNEAVKIVISFADARNNLGVLYMEQGRYDEAEKQFVLAQQDATYRQSPMLWNNMGKLARKRGDIGKAIRYFAESLHRNERYYPSLLDRGECYEEIGRNEEAVKDYEKAKEFLPNDTDLVFRLGRVQAKLGRYQDARENLERVCVLAPLDTVCREANDLLNTLP